MSKKKMMMSLAMAAMLTISAGFSAVAYAEEPAQTESSETKTAAEQNNEQYPISISSYMYDIEAEIGTSQTLMISLTTDPNSSIDLSDYELIVNRLSGDSNIVVNGKDSLEGIGVGGIVHTTLDLSYEIPQAQDLTGTNLKFTLQIKEKESGTVIGESPEYTIYPYEIKDGVLTYRDTSKNPKYLLTVEQNDYIDSWSLDRGETGNETMIYDRITGNISYYLDPDCPNVLFLKPKSGCLIKNVELTPSQAGTITEVENNETSIRYTVQIKEPAAVKATCIPATEAKVWQSVVEDYINDIRFTDWFTGDEINNHFFKDAAPVNDIASVTLSNLNYSDYPYNTETYNYEIPYDEFVTLAKDYFVNVPDLTGVDFYRVSYDPTLNCMLVPSGGIGNPMLITEFVKATDIGNGRYALHFNVSKEEWAEEKPDMGNKDAYTECTLTVEAGEKGLWKYVSFEKGYTDGTAGEDIPVVDDETSAIIEKIENAETGSSVSVDMSQSTVVSKDVLSAAKGKDVNLVLEMDGYSWVINGKDIQNAKDLDLDVAFDANAIPADIVKAVAGSHHTKQLSLAYDGQFGLKAKLQINVGKDYVKQYGNLYWYHNDALELTDTNQVDENGLLTLTFEHASDYVIVFDDQAHQTTAPVTKPETSTPKTGNQIHLGLYASMLAMSGLLIAGLAVLRKKK